MPVPFQAGQIIRHRKMRGGRDIGQAELPAATRGSQEAYGRIVHACQNTVTAIALAITRDVARVFNFITGYARPDKMDKLYFSPVTLKQGLVSLIDQEIANASPKDR